MNNNNFTVANVVTAELNTCVAMLQINSFINQQENLAVANVAKTDFFIFVLRCCFVENQ